MDTGKTRKTGFKTKIRILNLDVTRESPGDGIDVGIDFEHFAFKPLPGECRETGIRRQARLDRVHLVLANLSGQEDVTERSDFHNDLLAVSGFARVDEPLQDNAVKG